VLADGGGGRVSARINPVTKLGVALLLAVVLVLSLDVVSAGVVLVAALVLAPLSGARLGAVLRRSAPLLVAGILAGVTTALYGIDSGPTVLVVGPVTVTTGSLVLAAAISVRVLAIGVPGVILFASIDPTDLADGLAQRLHLPARFVLGALAAFRLVGLLAEDWRDLALARRARGVADHGRLRRTVGQGVALLVLAVRRGTKLATAMEARGFGAPGRRTWSRPSRFGPADLGLLGIGLGVSALAVMAAVLLHSWRFVGV
jgi:energy-coupling factor transport system permease protein